MASVFAATLVQRSREAASSLLSNFTQNKPFMRRYYRMSVALLQRLPEQPFGGNEVAENLFLGNVRDAFNLKALQERGMTHIVTIIAGIEPFFPTRFSYLAIDALDIPGESLDLAKSTEFIEKALSDPKSKVSVHCIRGRSRSATVVIAYMMKKYRCTWRQAMLQCQSHRPIVLPNPGFIRQLRSYQQELGIPADEDDERYFEAVAAAAASAVPATSDMPMSAALTASLLADFAIAPPGSPAAVAAEAAETAASAAADSALKTGATSALAAAAAAQTAALVESAALSEHALSEGSAAAAVAEAGKQLALAACGGSPVTALPPVFGDRDQAEYAREVADAAVVTAAEAASVAAALEEVTPQPDAEQVASLFSAATLAETAAAVACSDIVNIRAQKKAGSINFGVPPPAPPASEHVQAKLAAAPLPAVNLVQVELRQVSSPDAMREVFAQPE